MKKALLIIIILLNVGWASANSWGDKASFIVENSNNVHVDIFPNPSTDYLFIEFQGEIQKPIKIEIKSMIGNEIKVQFEKIETNKYKIKTSGYVEGYYFLVITDQAGFKKTFRFLKR